jgi:CheY-like chemotaxis protein
MNSKLKELNILYVEDDDFIREQTCGLLKIIFKNVYTACNGNQGVKEFDLHPEDVDAIITDINMPELSGIDMAKIINQKNKKTPKTPIIAVSAYSCDDYAMSDLQKNFAHYIRKPIQIKDLIHSVENAIDGKLGDYCK